MLEFLVKNRHNTLAIEKLTKQHRDTNEKFEFKSEKIATRVISFPSVLLLLLEGLDISFSNKIYKEKRSVFTLKLDL